MVSVGGSGPEKDRMNERKERGREGERAYLVVGSSVANSRSSAKAPACVKPFRRVDLPLLVYPTRATTG